MFTLGRKTVHSIQKIALSGQKLKLKLKKIIIFSETIELLKATVALQKHE